MKRSVPLTIALFTSALFLSAAQAQSPIPRPTASKASQAYTTHKPTSAQQSPAALSPSAVITSPTPSLRGETDKNAVQSRYESAQYRLNWFQTWFNGFLVF